MRPKSRRDAYVGGLFDTGTWRQNVRVDVRRLFLDRIVDSQPERGKDGRALRQVCIASEGLRISLQNLTNIFLRRFTDDL